MASRRSAAPRRPSRALLRFFDLYLFLYYRRHFRALRLAGAEHWAQAGSPLIVCLNHPSWWDPLTALLLSRFLARPLAHYAPIDAREAKRYGVLSRLGLFPVEQGTPRGAAQFLRGAESVLSDPNAILWLTPQGEFTDVRPRPPHFRAGLDALLERHPSVTVLPLAIEYTFWNERLPEALCLLGEPVLFSRGDIYPGAGRSAAVAAALAQAQDRLAALSTARDAAPFRTVLSGRSGTAGVYGLWQRVRAVVTRRPYMPDHAPILHEPAAPADRA